MLIFPLSSSANDAPTTNQDESKFELTAAPKPSMHSAGIVIFSSQDLRGLLFCHLWNQCEKEYTPPIIVNSPTIPPTKLPAIVGASLDEEANRVG